MNADDRSSAPAQLRGLQVDICIFTVASEKRNPEEVLDKRALRSLPNRWLEVLLVKRAEDPFANSWALPGGLTNAPEETLEQAAIHQLREQPHIDSHAQFGDRSLHGMFINQVRAYYDPRRDERGYTPTVCFAALVNESYLTDVKAGDASKAAHRFRVEWIGHDDFRLVCAQTGESVELSQLAFDHAVLIRDAISFVQAQVMTTTVAKNLLPPAFTIAELHATLSAMLPTSSSTTNFSRDIVKAKSRDGLIVEATDEAGNLIKSNLYSARPAQLYRFRENCVPKASIYPRV